MIRQTNIFGQFAACVNFRGTSGLDTVLNVGLKLVNRRVQLFDLVVSLQCNGKGIPRQLTTGYGVALGGILIQYGSG